MMAPMPIRPENRARYPKDWSLRSRFVRFVRARGRCEWCGAEHGPSGLVVRFAPAIDADALDGEAVNGHEVARALAERHGQGEVARMLARLMREAGDVWRERRQ